MHPVQRFILTRGAELLVLTALLMIPLVIDNPFALGLLTLLAIYGVLLIGLDVTVGYLGQVNLAQAAFLGLGAYAASLSVAHFGLGMFAALAIGFFTSFILGGLLAFPALRLEGPQFALATLSFSALTATTLNEMEWLTNGAQGLQVTRPNVMGMTLDAPGFYWLCILVLALVWLAMRNLLNSQWGRAFEALRDSPIATDAMGVGTYRHKVAGFAIGSGLGGLAGALYAFNFQFLQPHSFVYELMIILLLGVVLGGRKSLWGAFIGATIIVLLPNLLSNLILFRVFAAIGFVIALLSGILGIRKKSMRLFQALAPLLAMTILVIGSLLVNNIEDWRKAIFALMLFAVVVGLPEGLMGFATQHLKRIFRIESIVLPTASALTSVLPIKKVTQQPLLEIQHLKHYFGGVKAVDDINLSIHPGEIHGLIGPNGSGKSTVVNVISGLYAPSDGIMQFQQHHLPRGSLFRVARTGIARTFQNLQIFSEMTTIENVMVALRDHYHASLPRIILGFANQEEQHAKADALALLQLFGLADRVHVRARDLPYGAQRFLEIARALARKPELLILDEPAAGLAHPDAMQLISIIHQIKQMGITIILIEHHMDVVSELCDTVTVLDGGRIIASGKAEDIKRNPKVIEAYLGSAC